MLPFGKVVLVHAEKIMNYYEEFAARFFFFFLIEIMQRPEVEALLLLANRRPKRAYTT